MARATGRTARRTQGANLGFSRRLVHALAARWCWRLSWTHAQDPHRSMRYRTRSRIPSRPLRRPIPQAPRSRCMPSLRQLAGA